MNGPARTNRLAVRLLAGLVPMAVMIGATVSARQPGVPTVATPVPDTRRNSVWAKRRVARS
jgi:hypothetical protein